MTVDGFSNEKVKLLAKQVIAVFACEMDQLDLGLLDIQFFRSG